MKKGYKTKRNKEPIFFDCGADCVTEYKVMFSAACFYANNGGQAGWVSGCHDGVGPAGGRGVMQGVGGDSSVSHCTQGVTSAGWERERERWDKEREKVDRETKRWELYLNLCVCSCLAILVRTALSCRPLVRGHFRIFTFLHHFKDLFDFSVMVKL